MNSNPPLPELEKVKVIAGWYQGERWDNFEAFSTNSVLNYKQALADRLEAILEFSTIHGDEQKLMYQQLLSELREQK